MAILDGLANCTGPLDPDIKRRLRAVIENPTSETWERAYALMLRPSGMTLWRAVSLVDPSYPTTGPGDDTAAGATHGPESPTS